MIVLLMGVQGSGKTAVGQALAARLGWRFADGDDFHSAANKAKMSSGIPLNDSDRAPWLGAIRKEIDRALSDKEDLVIACSALKERYRQQLVTSGVQLVYLRGSQELIRSRLAARVGHFAKLELLASQFEQLEEPVGAITIDIEQSVDQVVNDIVRAASLR